MKKSNSKIWGGRFSSSTDQLMEEFNSSIQFDKDLYIEDIEEGKMTLEKSSNYEDIKKAIDTYETHLEIFMGVSMISRVWIIPYNGGIDNVVDYTVNK